MLPSPGDSAVLFDVGNAGVVAAERLTPAGAIDPTFGGPTVKRLTLGFGGGGSSFVFGIRPGRCRRWRRTARTSGARSSSGRTDRSWRSAECR